MKYTDKNKQSSGDIIPENKDIIDHITTTYYQQQRTITKKVESSVVDEMDTDENYLSNNDLVLVEQKCENIYNVEEYGNVFIETETSKSKDIGWKDSGIKVTESQFWCFRIKDWDGTIFPQLFCTSVEHIWKTINEGIKAERPFVKYKESHLEDTGYYVRGYLVPYVRLLFPYLVMTDDFSMYSAMTDSRVKRSKVKEKVRNKVVNQIMKDKKNKQHGTN